MHLRTISFNGMAGSLRELTNRRLGRTIVFALSVSVLLSLVGVRVHAQSPAPSKEAVSGDTANGKRLFSAYGCYECHGSDAQGGTGPRIAPPAISVQAMMKYVRHPAGQMPPYTAKVVPDRDLSDIYAFLESIPKPTPAAKIPLLNP